MTGANSGSVSSLTEARPERRRGPRRRRCPDAHLHHVEIVTRSVGVGVDINHILEPDYGQRGLNLTDR
ncbi:hypothetical protein QGN32_19980 [Mycolicibacterium sp. ND9-15]|uniref:hypothetical protein n=1 Tax=Mycolicibacterium sp. ND9-15 TaxID=3042320 RepID=UPI002DDC826A|nr:hypothetical protein [Mycolicibacterium sp. ND9-15]WSE58996.1 hypothetical protein QGN32_19980 [Mycolicibacterium sp. ND9-15]